MSLGAAEPEETEALKLWKCPFEQALKMALNGEIRDVLSVLSIIQTQRMLEQGLLK